MSLIPYSSQDRESQDVVLRHQSTLVLYNPKLKQLALRDLSPGSRTIDTLSVCPFCHRTMADDHEGHGEGMGHPVGPDPGFVDRDYFRMLNASHNSGLSAPGPVLSPQHAPPSPTRRRLPHPARVDDIDDHHDPDPHKSSTSRRASTGGISSAAFTPGYFERFFVSEGELGKGGNGIVLLVRHVLDGVSLGHFACKRVPVGDNHEWLEKVLSEVQLLQQLSHINLVSYRHVWLESVRVTNFGPEVPCAFILQQYCNGGDLHNYILGPVLPSKTNTKEDLKDRIRRRSRGQPEFPIMGYRRVPFEQIISFFRDIAAGLLHLHSNGFIHRDLKPSNCLLTDSGIPGQPPRVLVSDFGEVQIENTMRSSTGATGTLSYCAPEVLQRVTPGGAYGNFTIKSDIFSLGMILYFMCFGNLPYECADSLNEENEDLDRLRAEISGWNGFVNKERLRPDLPEKLYASLERLLSPNPSNRPTAEEILVGLNMGMGGNEDGTPIKRTSHSPSGQEDGIGGSSIGFRRISPISDTPPSPSRSNSPRRRSGYSTFDSSYKPTNSTSAPTRPSRLRGLPMSPEDSSPTSSDGAPVPTPSPGTNSTGPSHDSSLILRPRMNSQTTLRLSELPRVLPPLTRRARVLAVLRSAECEYIVKISLFLSKTVLLFRPCSPLAPNPWIFYPLLSLALLDFTGSTARYSLGLLLIHMIVFSIASTIGSLCLY